MTTIIIELVYNLALLVALTVVSGFVDARWRGNTRPGVLLQGVIFGGGGGRWNDAPDCCCPWFEH